MTHLLKIFLYPRGRCLTGHNSGNSQTVKNLSSIGVETGGCPHTATPEDASMNLEAVEEMASPFKICKSFS